MINHSLIFRVSAIAEVATGLALLTAPLLVATLLLGDGLGPTGVAIARIMGVALISVGISAWESPGVDIRRAPRAGLCFYNVGAAIAFVLYGTFSDMDGMLLWPAAVLHTLMGAAMLWALTLPKKI